MKCSKCNSTNVRKFVEEPKYKGAGHRESVQCLDCGHSDSWYVKSPMEKLLSPYSNHYVEKLHKVIEQDAQQKEG